MEEKTGKPRITPKDFFLWFGAMLSLYVSTFSFLSLFFSYIDNAFPDPLTGYTNSYSGSISFAIASLIVLFPTFLLLTHFIRKDIRANSEKKELWIRRWALYLTLFIAGATVIIDLITLINYFLNGNITADFALKILVVLLVAGAGFLHFLADLRGYWDTYPTRARNVAWATGILVLLTILSGFLIIGAPWNVRLYNFDDQKVSDLQSIQNQIVNYWQENAVLPSSLSDLNDSISGFIVPVDEQTGKAYEYKKLSKTDSFELCATFNAETQPGSPYALSSSVPVPTMPEGMAGGAISDTWLHAAGNYCFLRTIDPARYPVITK